MKIIVIGTGVIGGAVARALAADHEVITASRSGATKVDITDVASLERLFGEASASAPGGGALDAIVCCAGDATFKPLDALTRDDVAVGIRSKLMGQVDALLIGRRFVRPGGSITLTSGVLARRPMPGSAAVSLVNGALESFVRAAALESGRVRVNVVSPGWITETMVALGMDPAGGVPADVVARAYVEAVEGTRSGETIEVVG
jgi:NAD(P)-dependent dehydrogenase (short-subunit alcohol dehydrogenase family)